MANRNPANPATTDEYWLPVINYLSFSDSQILIDLMKEFIEIILFLIAGIASVTIIDTFGAIASRKFRFRYEYLAIISFAVYFFIGYFMSSGLALAILTGLAVGFYDGTIGLKISQKLKPHSSISEKEFQQASVEESLVIMLVVSTLLSGIGNAVG